MKKLRRILILIAIFAVSVLSVVSFIGCSSNSGSENGGGNNNSFTQHIHNYSNAWVKTPEAHWRECKNDGCDAKIIDKNTHSDMSDDGKCDECGYVVDAVKGELLKFALKDDGTYTVKSADNSISGELVIPETYKNVSVTSIGTNAGFPAFENCNNITSVIIPKSIKSIESASFYGCNSITSMTIPFIGANFKEDGHTHLGHLFSPYTANNYNSNVPKSLKTVIITGGTLVDEDAFHYCENIATIILPNSINYIGKSAFNGCTSLTEILIPMNVSSIGAYAFYNCSKLTKIKYAGTITQWEAIEKKYNAIPDSVTVICLSDNGI